MKDQLRTLWGQLWKRLADKELLDPRASSLSLRIPGTDLMWVGCRSEAPECVKWREESVMPHEGGGLHATVYRQRPDVGAVLAGGGAFGQCLDDWGGTIPQVFDEQARHLGPMPPPTVSLATMGRSLNGVGNVLLVQGQPVCLGITGNRLALNAELFEKCAKAYVLAAAAGGPVKPLPWLVRWIANGRLRKDEARACARLKQGLLPEESKGY